MALVLSGNAVESTVSAAVTNAIWPTDCADRIMKASTQYSTSGLDWCSTGKYSNTPNRVVAPAAKKNPNTKVVWRPTRGIYWRNCTGLTYMCVNGNIGFYQYIL